MRVRSDADQLASIAATVDAGKLRIDISATYPLSEIAAVHQKSDAGEIRGEALLVPA